MEMDALQTSVRPVTPPGRGRLPDPIPAVILESNLMKRGGFDVFEGLVDERMRSGMLAEALSLMPEAIECEVPANDDEEVRGGKPRRRFSNGRGGPLQQAFTTAPWLLDFLRDLTNPTLIYTGDIGTYSYYLRKGDHLDIHRDIVTCDVAVITCLHDLALDDEAGRLCLYPDRFREPLSEIRATPDQGAVKVRVAPGQTIVFYGGIVPHALLPVVEGQARIVSVLCYRAV
jgi:hypothetical protein